MKAILRVVSAASLVALCAGASAAQWKEVAKGRGGALWIDVDSIKRNGAETAFDFRLDFPRAQKERQAKDTYRSSVTRARVRCGAGTISIGHAKAYSGVAATGTLVSEHAPSPEESRFQPPEPNTSDEDLVRYVCPAAKGTAR
jgi:hypothetical protein